jgi:hypothetical protein
MKVAQPEAVATGLATGNSAGVAGAAEVKEVAVAAAE